MWRETFLVAASSLTFEPDRRPIGPLAPRPASFGLPNRAAVQSFVDSLEFAIPWRSREAGMVIPVNPRGQGELSGIFGREKPRV